MQHGIQRLAGVHLAALGAMALIAVSSCAPRGLGAPNAPALTSAARPRPDAPEREAADVPGERRLLSRPELRVAVFAPKNATYRPSTGGPGLVPIDVVVTNTAQSSADITGIRFRFAVRRDGVEFPCREAWARPADSPVQLLPGASVAYERALDCVIPVLGAYDVDVLVSFGAGSFDGQGDLAGRFVLNVNGTGSALPRPHPAMNALHLALVGETSVPPIPRVMRGEGYQVHAILANTGRTPIELAPMRLSLRVAAGKHHLACATEPFEVRERTTIEPGRVTNVPLPVACNLDVKGDYEVTAFVALAEDPSAEDVEMGRLEVHIAGGTPAQLAPWKR